MPARTLNDFFAGFFVANAMPVWRSRWRLQGQNDRRTGNRRQSARRKGDIKVIRIEGDKEQAVAVRHETVSQRKERSIWSWHEEFAVAWSETLITKKRKRDQERRIMMNIYVGNLSSDARDETIYDRKLMFTECFSKSGIPRRKYEQENLRSQPPLPGHRA